MLSKGERTRASILQAAHDLFINQGFHATSMRQIATQADIALGGIYNHFGGKAEIFREVLLTFHPYREVLQTLTNSGAESFEDLIHFAGQSITTTLEQRPDYVKLILIEIVEFKNAHLSDLHQEIFPQVMELFQQFTDTFPDLRPIPFPLMFRAFMGLLISYFISEYMVQNHLPTESQENSIDTFMDIFLHGVLSSEET